MMMDLSEIEATLLFAIIESPGRTLTFYGEICGFNYIQTSRAAARLKEAKYVRSNDNNAFYISDAFLKKETQAIAQEHGVALPVEEAPATVEVAPVEEKETEVDKRSQEIIKEAMSGQHKELDLSGPPTVDKIRRFMADGQKRTASLIAATFGLAKGTNVAQLLRTMTASGELKKDGIYYVTAKPFDFLRKPEPAVEEEKPVIHALSKIDLKMAILALEQSFTAKSCFEILSAKHKLDYDQFMDEFEDFVTSPKPVVLCLDQGVFIDPTTDYSPDATYVIRRDLSVLELKNALVAYKAKNIEPYFLNDIVLTLRVDPKEIISELKRQDYNVTNLSNIRKRIPAPSVNYSSLESLESRDITDFIGSGCRFTAFMKKFLLDPAKKDEIVQALLITGVAEYDAETEWVFPPREKEKKSANPEPEADPELAESLAKELSGTAEEILQETEAPIPLEELERELAEVVQPNDKWQKPGQFAVAEDGLVVVERNNGEKEKHIRLSDLAIGDKLYTDSESQDVVAVKPAPLGPKGDKGPGPCTAGQTGNVGLVCDTQAEPVKADDVSALSPDVQQALFDILAGNVQLGAPTGHPPHVWTEQEKADLVKALRKVAVAEGRLPADELTEKESAELIEEFRSGALEDDRPKGAHIGSVIGEAECQIKPAWLVTLQMLEERLRFEHQGMAATHLKDIREYLEQK